MRFFGLSDLGNILLLDVEEGSTNGKKIIKEVTVLDTDKATFTVEYQPDNHGEVMFATVTKNPKEIHERISKVRVSLEQRELAFMQNIFQVDRDEFSLASLRTGIKEQDDNPGFVKAPAKKRKRKETGNETD